MADDHEGRQRLATAYLRQAAKRMAAARALLAAGSWEDAVSRAYYGAFQSVTAALASAGLEAKTHDGARTLFSLYFVRTGRISPEIGRTVAALQREREASDYDAFPFIEEEEARDAVARADGVVRAIAELLTAGGEPAS